MRCRRELSVDIDLPASWTGEHRLCAAVIQDAIRDLRDGPPSPGESKRLEEELRGQHGRSAQRMARSRAAPVRARQTAFRSAYGFLFGQPSHLDFMAAGLGVDADRIRNLARSIADSWSSRDRFASDGRGTAKP
jgi:hypothetical protein